MIYTPKPTTKFKKDLKRIEKRNYKIDLLTEVIKKLSKGETLDENYRDHLLIGNYKGCRECHLSHDWLFIYEIAEDTSILYLIRTGTHTDLFDL